MEVPQAFGKVLKRIRTEKGLSQEELGNFLGMHRTHISLMERGKRTPLLTTVYDISTRLEIPLPDLMVRMLEELKNSQE